GVHVDSVELVVHVDPQTEHKAYLHRSGRTARAGSAGDVVTVMTPDQRKDTLTLLRRPRSRPPRRRSRPTPPRWPSSSVRSPTTSPRSRRNRPADPSSPADPPTRRAPQVRDASAGPAAGAAAVPVSRLGPAT